MLSIESPPRDPCPPSQISSQLKTNTSNSSSIDDEKKASSDNKLHVVVDLFKSDHPLPSFCIRDYVFDTRSKDIKNNWPFSQEKLQLCLKHGLTNLLPPFQSPDDVRKPSLQSNLNAETSGLNDDDHGVFLDSDISGCNPKLAADCLDTSIPSGSEGGKEFQSTITSQSCSEIDSSAPNNKSPELEADTLPELSVAKPEVVIPPAAYKKIQAQVKKYRLVVKLSNSVNPSAKEDTSLANIMVSEAMASKVCPVCKTFSSSSNTTLNAHIDQCLSGEPKVIKHRIKPRKIKSMVEIYATAPHCTLEELDRRNGTNWAVNSIFPAQEMEAGADQEKQRSSTAADLVETPDEGAVYIDANGTKLRILSKSNDSAFLSKAADGPRLKKLANRDKVTKLILQKKKKQTQSKKRYKLVKKGRKICTSQPHRTSEIGENQDENLVGEERFEEVAACTVRQFKAQDQVKFSRPDIIPGWVCSKRTGLTKKINGRDHSQHSVESVEFSSGCSHVKSSCGRRTANINQNPLSSPDDETRELPSLRKRCGVESQASLDRKRYRVIPGFSAHNVKRLRSYEPANREDYASFVSKRMVKMNAGFDRKGDHSVVDPKKSFGRSTDLTKGRGFSCLRNKLLSSGRASVPDSKLNFKRKFLALKKSESNEGAVSLEDREHLKQCPGKHWVSMGRTGDMESFDRTGVLKPRKSGGETMISRQEEAMALKTTRSVSTSYHHDAEDHDGFTLDGDSVSRPNGMESSGKSIHSFEEDFDMDPPSEAGLGEAFMDFGNSLDAQLHRLAGASDGSRDSQRFTELFKEPSPSTCSAEPLSGGLEMYSTAEVPDNMIRDNVNVVAAIGSGGTHGNYFAEVDPIPIPGPPGSFLPSPGHMDSEDLQGNSSLTSSRVQSSDDLQELVDQSSDSPVSVTSTISNSTLARFDSKSLGMLLVGVPSTPNGFVMADNGDHIADKSSLVLADTNGGAERISLDELKVQSTMNDMGAFKFKNDQRCCCSRKEGFSQSVSLKHQESQLLRRRTMAAVAVPASGKELTCDADRRLQTIKCEIPTVRGHSLGVETFVKAPMGHIQRITAGSGESDSPPTSNPVLRLMGKDLVVNKGENYANPQVLPALGVSVVNPPNETQRIAPHVVPHTPFCFDQMERSTIVMQHSEWADGYRSHEKVGTQQMSLLMSPAMLSSGVPLGGLGGSLMHREYIAGYNLPAARHQSLNEMGAPDTNKLVKSPSLGFRNANASADVVKEIIVIDDPPENDIDSTTVAAHNSGMVQGMESSSAGKAMAVTSACDSRKASNFYSYQQYERAATYCGSPAGSSFWMPSPNAVKGNGAKWNVSPLGPSALYPSPLPTTSTSSSAAQLRSRMYTYMDIK